MRTAAELARDLRIRAALLLGAPWEAPATAAIMCEAADLLDQMPPSAPSAVSADAAAAATERAAAGIPEGIAPGPAAAAREVGEVIIEPRPGLTAEVIVFACDRLALDLTLAAGLNGWLGEDRILESARRLLDVPESVAGVRRELIERARAILPDYSPFVFEAAASQSHTVAGSETSGSCPTAGDIFLQGIDPGDENDCRDARRLAECE